MEKILVVEIVTKVEEIVKLVVRIGLACHPVERVVVLDICLCLLLLCPLEDTAEVDLAVEDGHTLPHTDIIVKVLQVIRGDLLCMLRK